MQNIILNIYFDGGSLGNPGKGYGSFEISDDESNLIELKNKIEFGNNLTCNQAEYLALIKALEKIIIIAENKKEILEKIKLNIFGDSKLVVMQVKRKWKVKNKNMIDLFYKTTDLLRNFNSYDISWYSRNNNLIRFGH